MAELEYIEWTLLPGKLVQHAVPEADRAELAAFQIGGLDQEVHEDAHSAWDSETLRRLTEMDSGTVKPTPWRDARRMIMGNRDESAGGRVSA